ncbi:efflux RND transporter permease subunit [Aquirufa antheringensis]|uniref:efflux RND transporter permease subunit n=1 Tax=Aquirufa antheringensis TaxID=2516559 RepID=UPI0022A8470D|nr:efflux RND transporter permease subunit [Aquirufa antheringensis]MCZ2487301.1 efflux RND transporter permease subunit [Aquirufa antheringensis]
MKIANYAVKNYQFTLTIFLMVVVVGIVTIMTMPRSEDPDMNAPQFPIIAVYPGTSPDDMEELVVKPVEKRLYELENVRKINTTISDGLAVFAVYYKYGVNVDEKYSEIVRELNSLKGDLPKEVIKLEAQKATPSGTNVLQMALISNNASLDQLKITAERLQEDLEKVTALKKVTISGLPESQVKIDLNIEKMAQMQVSPERVLQAIQSEIANIPGGSIVENSKSFNILTSGNYQNIDEIKNTIVFSYQGKNVLLTDVAKVYFDYAPENHITRLNQNRCLFVTAAQKSGENIAKTQAAYEPVIAQFKKTLPKNIDLVVNFDQAENVNTRLSGLLKDFIIAILLVALTLLPLGLRAASIVMISIPLSLAIGIILLNIMGYSLNQLSIVGLVVALGLLVDDSIVVVENIERWMREGHSRLDATLKATNQIGMAVLGCTVTLIIAFLPLVFLPEASGEFIRSLPMAVIFCIVASLVVSLTVVPFLSSRILKSHQGNPEGNLFMRVLKKLISGSYSRLLDWAIIRPKTTLLIALVIFAASLRLFPVVGFSLFPASEKPQFMVNIFSPLQSNMAYTDSVSKLIESDLRKLPEVKYVSANVGKGNPRIYYNAIPLNDRTDYGNLFVQLQDDLGADEKINLIEKLRTKYTNYPAATIEVKNFEQGPPVVAPVEVRILGDNVDTLRQIASRVETMLKNTKGTIYVKNPLKNLKSDIKFDINKEKASMLGIPTVSIDRMIRLVVAGFDLGKMTDKEGKEYAIVVSKPHPKHPSLEVFDNLYVNNVQGTAIPLSQVASVRLQTSPVSISHLNKNRLVSVSSFVEKGFLNNEVIAETEKNLEKMALPAGYHFEMGGEVESANESFSGFGTIILVTIFFFIAVLILEFGTFKSTLIVLSVIPLGIVGALLALWFTGTPLSFVATVGLIALAGIEVKNTILLVDFTNQLRAEGMPMEQAIREAGEVRFLPIILTTLTAIGGLIPIAISTNPLISPLAIVMIGGLISSTLLSRIVTPVVYKLIPPAI